jgi:hypothetical protein
VSAPVIATTRRARTLPQFGVLALAALVAVAAAITTLAIASSTGSPNDRSVVENHYVGGYPLHGGLAGPSRVSIFEHPSYGAGYPTHGGLAGPNREPFVVHPGYGAGYPLHGGLAGPSQPGDLRLRPEMEAVDTRGPR